MQRFAEMDRAPTLPRMTIWVLCGLFVATSVGCKSAKQAGASPSPAASTMPSSTSSAEPVASAKGDDAKPVYPLDVGAPDPVARRLCDAVQTQPAVRKAACCETTPVDGLNGECVRMLTAAMHDGSVTVEAADVDRCAEASKAAYDGCDWVTPILPSAPTACTGVVHGHLEDGKRCRSSLECVPGLYCRGLGPTDAGVCAKPAAAGSPCSLSVDALAAAVRASDDGDAHPECSGACVAKRCADRRKRGETCTASPQCAPGDHCANGTCVAGAYAKLGETCDDACEPGASCLSFKCAKLKAAGETCESPFECQAACVRPSDSQPGTCGMKCSAWPPAGYPGGSRRPVPAKRSKG
jgi:hypothetical protein